MTPNRKYLLLRGLLNITSGISLITIISLGIAYMSFSNAFVFQDIKIEISNNPVEGDTIDFVMIGSKKHECNSIRVYGVAYSDNGHMHMLDKFKKQYVRNTRPGEEIPNQWTMIRPDAMSEGGEYRVSITGDFVCNYLIFQTEKSQTYDNIPLTVAAAK